MKYKLIKLATQSLDDFAAEHNLELVVRERHLHDNDSRYYAQFKNTEVKDGSVLVSTFGNGRTPDAAVREYARLISGKLLVVNVFRPNGQDIPVPQLDEAR